MRSRAILFSFVTIIPALFACSEKKRESPEAAPAQANIVGNDWTRTLDDLQDSVRARALRGDTTGLVRLMVGESTYRQSVYPVSPSYDSTREEVFRFVLGMHMANSAKGLRRLLADLRDTANGEVLREKFRGTPVPDGVLHEVSAAPERSGVRLFGSALCTGEQCRVLSFSRAGAHRKSP